MPVNGVNPPLLSNNSAAILFNVKGVPHIPFHGTGVDLSDACEWKGTPMSKRMITAVLAASIAFTSLSVTPVRAADSGEIGRFLLGAGTLFIIGSAISNNNRNRGSDTVTTTRRHTEPTHRVKPRRKVVPSACLRHNRFDNGPRKFFGQRCLNNNMRNAGRLPNQCRRTIWTNRGQRNVFAARCLRRNGWTFG